MIWISSFIIILFFILFSKCLEQTTNNHLLPFQQFYKKFRHLIHIFPYNQHNNSIIIYHLSTPLHIHHTYLSYHLSPSRLNQFKDMDFWMMSYMMCVYHSFVHHPENDVLIFLENEDMKEWEEFIVLFLESGYDVCYVSPTRQKNISLSPYFVPSSNTYIPTLYKQSFLKKIFPSLLSKPYKSHINSTLRHYNAKPSILRSDV